MRDEIRLSFDDPRVWARCEPCATRRDKRGQTMYFGKAYAERKWKKGQTCDNCGGPMTEIYRLKED